jgi:glucosamine--fructose-6-phosphate aminotransferase (isomerizing)
MCGIFGIITKKEANYTAEFLTKALKTLALQSEVRGKDSSGLCLIENSNINVFKGPIRVKELLKKQVINSSIQKTFSKNNENKTFVGFGHARLVTNGSQLNDDNNQPVIKDGIICVHNGIVVNVEELWAENQHLKREFEIDTEIIPTLVRESIFKKLSIEQAVSGAINKVFGTVSIAMAFEDLNKFVIATNNGSLYVIHNSKDILFFGSEKYILNEMINKLNLENEIGKFELYQVKANHGVSISLTSLSINNFDFKSNNLDTENIPANYKINLHTFPADKPQRPTVVDINQIHLNSNAEKEQSILIYPIDKIKSLKRCTKCILPETFPFIKFDDKGECNYCKNYKPKNKPKTLDELRELVEPYRSKDGSPDVLIPFSGGRDSTYVLHVVKKELGLNPIALTYDWGMVTDLARRNIAGICGKLGVENIIVAADIHWKRDNIRKNITAWLKKPDLGMIPLFMAGDKYFFYYANKVKKQTGIKLNIWGINHLENTDFKTGFAGIRPKFDKKRIYSLSLKNQAKLFSFVGKNLIQSPGYINQSVFDSLGSFAVRYIAPKTDYYHMFDYMSWDEKEIESTIINEYKWETAIDTPSTWRIGDGTASFYNYIYTLIAGFSENDTFRSNQIREGLITREEALDLIYIENKPRYNSLKWYLEIIGMDYTETIKKINAMKRILQ